MLFTEGITGFEKPKRDSLRKASGVDKVILHC